MSAETHRRHLEIAADSNEEGRFAGAYSRAFVLFDIGMKLLLGSLLVSIVVAQIMVALLAVGWVYLMLRGVRYTPTKLDIPLLAYIAVRVLSILFSEFPAQSTIAFSHELVFYVSYFFSAFYIQHADDKQLRRTLQWLVCSTAIVTIIASSQYLLGYTVRANGLSGGGTLATHLSLTVPLVLVYRKNRQLFPGAIIWWLGVVIFGVGLMCTLFRGEMIASAVVVGLYALVFNRRFLIALLGIVVMVVLIVPSIRNRIETLADPMNNSSDRLTLWHDACSHASEHPILGFGPDTFHQVFDDFEHTVDKGIGAWHNDFIQLYMESGALGVASWVVVLVLLFVWSIRLIRRGSPSTFSDVGWLGVFLLIAYLIGGIFGMPTFSITNAMLFRFLVAWIAVTYTRLGQSISLH